MFRIYKIFVLLFIISFSLPADAHVQHYDDLKHIEFEIYRNNKHIGKHTFSFKKLDGQLAVESEISFEIKKLGLVLYRYHVSGIEIYKDGKLIKKMEEKLSYFIEKSKSFEKNKINDDEAIELEKELRKMGYIV